MESEHDDSEENAEIRQIKQELNEKIKQFESEKKDLRSEIGKFMLGQNIIVGGKWSFSSKRIKITKNRNVIIILSSFIISF